MRCLILPFLSYSPLNAARLVQMGKLMPVETLISLTCA